MLKDNLLTHLSLTKLTQTSKLFIQALRRSCVLNIFNDYSNTLLVTVGPTSGSFTMMPSARAYQIFVTNFWPGQYHD